MLKVMTLIGTRPELIKMSRVVDELDNNFNHILVHSGQNYDYELNQIFFEQLEIRRPDYFLGVEGGSSAKVIADIIHKADDVFLEEKPDALLIYGDTNTGMAILAAKRRKIPIFHMEAGNRCFDQRVPEELNRKVIDHLSDINMVLTEHARRYLLAEGVRPETIIKTGSHMQEVLGYYYEKSNTSDVLEREKLHENKFFVVSLHREENVDDPLSLNNFLESLGAIYDKYRLPIVVSTHPRTRMRLEKLGVDLEHEYIRFVKPYGFLDYIRLQVSAFCVLSDSGTIFEEASLLNFPAVTLRNAHERPEAMDVGTLIMSSIKPECVLNSVRIVTEQHSRQNRQIPVVPDYEGGPVSKQIVRIVTSYVDYINRTVWSKL